MNTGNKSDYSAFPTLHEALGLKDVPKANTMTETKNGSKIAADLLDGSARDTQASRFIVACPPIGSMEHAMHDRPIKNEPRKVLTQGSRGGVRRKQTLETTSTVPRELKAVATGCDRLPGKRTGFALFKRTNTLNQSAWWVARGGLGQLAGQLNIWWVQVQPSRLVPVFISIGGWRLGMIDW